MRVTCSAMVVSVGVFEFHCVIIRCCKGGKLGRCGSGREGRGEERVRGMYVIYIYCEVYGETSKYLGCIYC